MSPAPLWVQEIEKRAGRAGGLSVLLVEGPEDLVIFEHFFDLHAPGWMQRFVIAEAGGKDHVRSGVVVHHTEWMGIMDLDEWSPADVQAAVAQSPRLRTLSRFCIESYFCHPNELWAALPAPQRSRVGDDPTALANPIYAELPNWVEHGAMWRVLRRLYHTAKIPGELDCCPVPDRNALRTILQHWHQQLEPAGIIAQYEKELQNAQLYSLDEQICQFVHGKRFYNLVVVPVLDHLFAGKGADDWLQKFRDAKISPPADLVPALDWVISLLP